MHLSSQLSIMYVYTAVIMAGVECGQDEVVVSVENIFATPRKCWQVPVCGKATLQK